MPSRRFAAVFIGALLLVAAAAANAAAPDIYTGRFSSLALGGYDPVAYFETGAPAKGSREFTLEHEGATWRFVSAQSREKFRANPAAYAPQYGGYCAWAIAQGYLAPGNPENWTVRGGKLYLNYNDKVQKDWLVDPEGFIARADSNWPDVLSK
ncbi:MAG: twin-arginine translocation pathway signal protein [Alphaproteobacteria bacterium RIFCSPHIGHO2_12_FULL_63_12]|nr:MAG: twin-arginine translocation pathway signal protein [Alphaproteobacteria bacterium RIFCSPHIGHO2_12_FULL_63_12]